MKQKITCFDKIVDTVDSMMLNIDIEKKNSRSLSMGTYTQYLSPLLKRFKMKTKVMIKTPP